VFKKFLFTALFIALLAACAELPSGNYIVVPVTGTLQGTVYQHCQDGTCWYAALATQVPFISPTPEDARTPTYTPLPTNTPKPTKTPTITPTPQLGACAYKVNTAALNVRATPGGTVLGLVHQNDTLAVDAYALLDGVKWYRIYWLPEQNGFVHSSYVVQVEQTDCSQLKDVTEPVKTVYYSGFHTLAAHDTGILLSAPYVYRYNLIKCLDNGFSLCQQAKAINPNILTIYRSYQHDCVPTHLLGSPEIWWDMIEGDLPMGADYYEVQNECSPPVEYSAQWTQFQIEMAKIVDRERNGAGLLAYSSGPGNPDIPFWDDMRLYLEWTKTHFTSAGRQHGIATHQSGNAPADVVIPSGTYTSWINSLWIANRELVFCAYLNEKYAFSCDNIFWIVSENGVTDGYSGTKDTFTCGEKAKIYHETDRVWIRDGIIDGKAWWNCGEVGQWSSDCSCVPIMLAR
jgi:hypothetical protein